MRIVWIWIIVQHSVLPILFVSMSSGSVETWKSAFGNSIPNVGDVGRLVVVCTTSVTVVVVLTVFTLQSVGMYRHIVIREIDSNLRDIN